MKNKVIFLLLSIFVMSCRTNSETINSTDSKQNKNKQYVNLSKSLLETIKKGEDYTLIQTQLANILADDLLAELHTDAAKKAFWINIYNAYIITTLTENVQKFENKGKFYKDKHIKIAGQLLSFDDIEHGFIRKSRIKWSLGLFGKWFPSAFERKFRVKKIDPRIHFALNCGAKSCPAVAIYDTDRINEQLDKATQIYLKQSSTYDVAANTAHITTLFSWFRGDFGWKRGIRKMLREFDVIPKDSKPKLKFKKYDWTLYLGNYIDL